MICQCIWSSPGSREPTHIDLCELNSLEFDQPGLQTPILRKPPGKQTVVERFLRVWNQARGQGISATVGAGDWPLRFPSPLWGWLLLPGILLRAPSPWELSPEVTPTSACSSTCWFPNCRWIPPCPHSKRTSCP